MPDAVGHAPLVAVVEDELPIRKFLRAALVGAGYRVHEAESAHEAMRTLTQEPPDLIILDLGLPDLDGKVLITDIRNWSGVPIIVLSARDQEQEKIAALDAGADDYLTKPFSVGELLARLRVALRHRACVVGGEAAQTTYTSGPVHVDLESRRVFRDGAEVKLTRREFELLATLVRYRGRVLTHRFLLKEVWGPHSTDETHYLRVFIATLRKKLEAEPARPRLIHTEQGVGYRLADAE